MPRSKRLEYPGACYHAMCRGNHGQEIFRTDDGRKLFLSTLGEACEQTGWMIHAYCLMSNHYHLLLETPEANLVSGMKWFQGTYTQRFNAMFEQRGHLFQGRYKAIPIQTNPRQGGLSYFKQVSTYIHLNPFRANLCGEGFSQKLETYPWSSYPAYCGKLRRKRPWLIRERVLKTWGLREGEAGTLARYREKIERKMHFEGDPEAGARGEFEKQIKRGWYLGSEEFREELLTKLDRLGTGDNYRGGQKREHNQAMAEKYFAAALEKLEMQESDFLTLKANRLEKQAVAWLLKTHTTVTGVWLSERLQLGHPSNTSRALKRFREGSDKKTRSLKAKMTKCKG